MEGRQTLESFKVETPVGSFESDSGNHVVDVLSVFIVIVALYVFKKFVIK